METMRKDWSMEDFLHEIPAVPGKDITTKQVLNYGASNYVYHIWEQDEADYLAYLKVLEEAGFVKYTENTEGVKGYYYSTTYEKEDIVLTVSHLRTAGRLSVSGCLNLYRNNRSEEEVFADVPVLDGEVEHRGDGTYMITVEDSDKTRYLDYLQTLEMAGFVKYTDNGDGLGGTVFSVTYTKGRQVVTVCYMLKLRIIYISVSIDLPLSDHLIYKDEYVNVNKEAKTKLHMMELWTYGNSFVFQLKNGHFLISDGGCEYDLPYLLDYLDSLTPAGQKPVVEAWMITHMHRDHCGTINAIAEEPEKFADRVFVDGFYYNEPNDNVMGIDPGCLSNIIYLKQAAEYCRTSKGEPVKIYRPQTGQRYYFCDITVDIVLCQEHLGWELFEPDQNDSSTWYMFTIEGQKCLLAGDSEKGGIHKVMMTYDSEYLDMDMFSLLHHGHSTRNEFTDYTKVKTVLVTTCDKTPKRREEQNRYLKELSQEWLMWGDGTKILTFPYEVGSYESVAKRSWIYNKGMERPIQPNMD